MGRITNLIPSHVSIVDKAANKRSFLLMKGANEPNVEADVKLLKRDEAQQIVYGVVYEPDVVDAHGDFMDAGEIEKAAHVFLKEFRNIDKQHDFTSKVGEVIESYIAPADFELGGQTVTKGTWMMAVKVVDDVWQSIEKGEYTGFSLAGYGNVEKAQETPQEPSEDVQTEAGFMKMMKQFFRRLAKGEIKNDIEASRPKNEMSRAIFHFTDIAEGELWRERPDVERIRTAHQELGEYINQFAASSVAKSEDEQGEEVMNMTKEEIQALIDEGVQKALAKQDKSTDEPSPQAIDEVEKSEESTDDTQDTTEQTELAKALERIAELEKQVDARPVAFSSGAEVAKADTKPGKPYGKFFG